MSGEVERQVLTILEEAIKREQAAQRLYTKGRDLSEDKEVRGVFSMLAEEEAGHEKLLKQIHHDYKKRLGLKVLQADE